MDNQDCIPAGYRLLQAHLILRHGDRAPTANIYDAPHGEANGITAHTKAKAESSYWTAQMPSPLTLSSLSTMFPVHFLDQHDEHAAEKLQTTSANYPFGLLTRRGLHGTFSIGQTLRAIYIDNNDNSLLPKDGTCTGEGAVAARSTAMKRTVESCQSVLHGFCRPRSMLEQGAVQVGVETGTALELANFGFMRERCPSLIKKWQASMATEHAQQVERETTPLVEELQQHYPMLRSTGMSHTSKLLKAFDHFKTHSAHDLATAKGTGEHTLHTLKLWAQGHFWRLYAAQHAAQTTLMCRRILDRMDRRLNDPMNTKVPRLCIYSGHDTTIMPTLATLMLVVPTPEQEWPPYGAHVRLELLQKEASIAKQTTEDEDSAYVRIVYQDRTILRSMNEFKAMLGSQQSTSFEVECQDHQDSIALNPFQDNR